MSIFSKLFGRDKGKEQTTVGGMEDFMLLIRVYYQAVMASQLGINNLGALPDLRIFKQTYHVATVNNKLGIAEKKHCRKLIQSIYKVSDSFFAEIDGSIRKHCHKIQDAQSYLIQFQGFSQDLMMLMGNLMKFKLRMPSFFKKAIYTMTEKTVNDLFTKNDFNDAATLKAVASVRKYNQRLNFSQEWITNFVFQLVMLAKKEKPQEA